MSPEEKVRDRGARDAFQDRCEGVSFTSVGGRRKHLQQAPPYIDEADHEAYLQGYREVCDDMFGKDWEHTPARVSPFVPGNVSATKPKREIPEPQAETLFLNGTYGDQYVGLHQYDHEVGRLILKNGMLQFTGEIHASARVWFEQVLKNSICRRFLEPDGQKPYQGQMGNLFFGNKVTLQNRTSSSAPMQDMCAFYLKDGKLRLQGDLDEAAREWFELALKPMCETYLKKKQSLIDMVAKAKE